jgi:hypothetical protein
MIGLWVATGRTVGESHFADGYVGETIRRLWRIERRCTDRRCHLEFTRQTRYGPVSSRLEWAGNNQWLSSSEEQTPCPGSGHTATSEAEWLLEITSSSISANETEEVPASADCNSAESEEEWTAEPAASTLGRHV